MTDNLRDRIAAAIHTRGGGTIKLDAAMILADAVIEALRSDLAPLLKEYNEARQYDADCGEADNSGNDAGDKLASYVTEWTTNE